MQLLTTGSDKGKRRAVVIIVIAVHDREAALVFTTNEQNGTVQIMFHFGSRLFESWSTQPVKVRLRPQNNINMILTRLIGYQP